ncbi:MAG: tetratricopeptide repeat protein [Parabacteroides sp.]|nr:tetratricopeptide repeat protein [Parabacteroides sp.]
MKNYLILWLLVLLAACQHAGRTFEVLDKAEEFIQTYKPDSAYTLLKEIPNPQQYPEKERARWCLLMTQAIDKTYRTHTSDSLIRFAVNYYEKVNDLSKLPTAFYTLGRVQRDLNDNEHAVNSFLKALDLAKGSDDYKLQYLAASQLGHVYAYSRFIDEALKTYQQALYFAEQDNDSISLSYANSYLGRVYGLQKDWNRSIEFYQKAISIAQQTSYIPALRLGLNELAAIYKCCEKYQEAADCLEQLISLGDDPLSGMEGDAVYLNLGDLYRLSENYDSAIPYLEKALQTKNLYTKRSAYQCFSYAYAQQGNYKKAVEYNNLYWKCNDSIQKVENRKAVIAVEAKYKHEKLLTEKQQLELKQSKLIFWGSSLLLVAIIIILLVYMDKKRITIRLFEQLHAIRSQIAENKRTIVSYQEQIDSLSLRQSDYDDLQQEKASLEQEVSNLLEQNEKLNSQKSQILVRLNQKDEEIKQYEEIIKQRENTPDIFTRIKQAHTIEEKEWPELIARTDALHQQFFERLRKAFPQLTETDLQLCCLMRLGYDKKEQKSLLKITDDSLEKRKQRLKRRLDPNKKWEKGELEQFIHHF